MDRGSKYAKAIAEGKILAPRAVKLLAEKHLQDLDTHPDLYDTAAVRRFTRFAGSLVQWKDRWAGEPFRLLPWQEFLASMLFGWRDTDGSRRYRQVYVEVPRKNGKTSFAAVVALYLLLADGIEGAEVYAAATKKDQARIVWQSAVEMVRRSPWAPELEFFKTSLSFPRTSSFFQPLASDEDTLDGLSPHGVIIDELHAHRTSGVWDVLTSAVGARERPIVFAITTAGAGGQDSICRRLHEYGLQVLEGAVEDRRFLPLIYSPDPEDRWDDPAVWRKLNPSLGETVTEEFLSDEAAKARGIRSEEEKFRRYYLCEWVQSSEAFIAPSLLSQAAGGKEIPPGSTVWAGLDLSLTTDLTALVWFREAEQGRLEVDAQFFLPRGRAEEMSREHRTDYLDMERKGWITLPRGDVFDFDDLMMRFEKLLSPYRVVGVGYDPWCAFHLAQKMERQVQMVEVRQSRKVISPAISELGKLFQTKRIRVRNPLLLRHLANMRVKVGSDGLLYPDHKSGAPIDGATALINALFLRQKMPDARRGGGIQGFHLF
jgi:phage terminase large subunit-like protein